MVAHSRHAGTRRLDAPTPDVTQVAAVDGAADDPAAAGPARAGRRRRPVADDEPARRLQRDEPASWWPGSWSSSPARWARRRTGGGADRRRERPSAPAPTSPARTRTSASTCARWTAPTPWSARSSTARSRCWPPSTASPRGSAARPRWPPTSSWRATRRRSCWPSPASGSCPTAARRPPSPPRSAGARAMRMALLAEPLSAQDAYDAGLVTHLSPAASYDDLRRQPGTAPGRGRAPGPHRHQARHQRRHPVRPVGSRPGARARAHRPDGADAHRRRRRGHAGVLRAAPAGVPGGVGASWAAGRSCDTPSTGLPRRCSV